MLIFNQLSAFLNSWYWYLLLPIALMAVLTFFPTVRKVLDPILEQVGNFFGFVLSELGITARVAIPDILHPIRTLVFVLLLMGASAFGGYVYGQIDQEPCPAVSKEIRKKYKLIPRKETSTTEKVKNWFGF